MKLTDTIRTLTVAGSNLRARRTTGGVLELWADDDLALERGLGYFHAHDRLVQMLLVRVIGQGRLCECLKDDDESLAIDTWMRQMNLAGLAREEAARLTPQSREFVQAYTDGVNHYLQTHRRPPEFWLVGYRPEPWHAADTLLTINLMSYVGLAQTQQDIEKLLIEAIHHGASVELLKKVFTPHLDGLTKEIVELIRQLQIVDPLVPAGALPAALPTIASSNNWAVAAGRSATGTALECHDPHLECNRLPAIWYEAVLRAPDDYHAGITMPGLPGIIMGRSSRLSAGFTYGFMDMVDYFIEECRGGKYRRDDGWHSFRERRETIWRKSHQALEIVFHENEHGTLECDPRSPAPRDGLYLCRAYAARLGGAARSLDVLAKIFRVTSVEAAQQVLRDVSISCNWVIADRAGNIGYQQSGLLPARRHSGLFPVPGWWSDHAWQGLVPGAELATLFNPPEGFIVTANDNRNQPGRPQAINVCQGSYRAERIAELLRAQPRLTVEDMRTIQVDLLSVQARRFMGIIRPLLPKTPAAAILADWDLRYDTASRGATLFEAFYHKLLRRVFGAGLFGLEAWDAVVGTTNLLGAYFQVFDEALFSGDTVWYGGRGRDGVFREVLDEVLAARVETIEPWGRQRRVVMHNVFFGGRLPRPVNAVLGVDYGPIELPGGRSTIVQGQILRTHGRLTSFAPSYRSVTDLGNDRLYTVLAGGPSGTIRSALYTTDIERWLTFAYKELDCDSKVS